MTTDDIVQEAEEYLVRGEKSGLSYPDAASRAQAKMALIESMTQDAKQENIPEAAAASEGGSVLGATGGADDLAGINTALDRLRAIRPQTPEIMEQRKALTKRQADFHQNVNPNILFSG